MGWFDRLLGKVAGADPKDYLFVPALQRSGGNSQPIVADETYIELYIDSLRISRARSFATRFHGVVYSYVSLARLADTDAHFASVTKPDKLTELDKDSTGKVITVSKKMLGPVPWRGGNLDLQLGLFSVKSGNVLTPLVDFIAKVSDVAGIGIVGAVKPFVPIISEGMDLIAGQTEDTRLLVGVDSSILLTGTMTCAIIALEKDKLDPAAVSIDPDDGKLLKNGAPLDAGYCVFSVRATDQKPDFGEIPELKQSYAEFRAAVVAGKEGDAREAVNAFARRALTSPDLISRDSRRLIALVRQTFDDAFGVPPPGAPAIVTRGGSPDPGVAISRIPASLSDLALYGS